MGKIIVIAGTPGVGKSSITKHLESICKLKSINLSELAVEKGFIQYYDAERKSYVIDEEKLVNYIRELVASTEGRVVIQTHYPEILPRDLVEKVFVLRTHPLVLEKRLVERGWDKRKINENVMAEILGIISSNVASVFGEEKIYEIDTTNTKPEEVAEQICLAIRGDTRLEPGVRIDWLSALSIEEVSRFEDYVGGED